VQLIAATGEALTSSGILLGVAELMAYVIGSTGDPLTGSISSNDRGARAARIWMHVAPPIARYALRRALNHGREAESVSLLRYVDDGALLDFVALGSTEVLRAAWLAARPPPALAPAGAGVLCRLKPPSRLMEP
jgi:hypothetical protein